MPSAVPNRNPVITPLAFVGVKAYPRTVEPDEVFSALALSLVAPQQAEYRPKWRWLHDPPKDRVTLMCGGCGRRIAWWTAELRSDWLGLQDISHRGWKWQGQGPCPVRFRGDLVDDECPSCGWTGTAVARQPEEWWLAAPEFM